MGQTPLPVREVRPREAAGSRVVLLAFFADRFAGYLTVCWESHYPPFREQGIPEVVDFSVVPDLRRRRIGTRLMDAAEELMSGRSASASVLGPLRSSAASLRPAWLRARWPRSLVQRPPRCLLGGGNHRRRSRHLPDEAVAPALAR
ncbi:MAG: GNAT family N-acetyltransferase [Dehalococcoidia bacterium]|nr:GNAT family N-acetyltransferase [Dehalococcoidia bacterium]